METVLAVVLAIAAVGIGLLWIWSNYADVGRYGLFTFDAMGFPGLIGAILGVIVLLLINPGYGQPWHWAVAALVAMFLGACAIWIPWQVARGKPVFSFEDENTRKVASSSKSSGSSQPKAKPRDRRKDT